MSLEITINEKIKQAMLAKNDVALRGLRAIKAAILLAKTSAAKTSEISEEEELKILQKLAKQRKESLEIFEKQNRPDLAIIEKQELETIESFLPAQMSEDEISAELKKILAKVGASSITDLGKVMGVASKFFAGKADGKLVAQLVKTLLA